MPRGGQTLLGVLLNQNLGGDGKPGGQKTIGFGGRRHTEEARKKISEKLKGVKLSNQHKTKLSLSKIGKGGKLSEDNVLWIRKNYIKSHSDFNSNTLSLKFNVSSSCILQIIKNKTWKHI